METTIYTVAGTIPSDSGIIFLFGSFLFEGSSILFMSTPVYPLFMFIEKKLGIIKYVKIKPAIEQHTDKTIVLKKSW